MNHLQILTLSLTLAVSFIGVLTGVLINNNRLNDVKELLRAEIRAESAQTRGLIEKHHSELMMKFLEMDNRLARLEAPRLTQ